MADEKKPEQPAKRDRRRDAEQLGAAIFAPLAGTAAQRGKTCEQLARDAMDAARAFYRVADEIEKAPPG